MPSEPYRFSVIAKTPSRTSFAEAKTALRRSWIPPPVALSSALSRSRPTACAATPPAKSAVTQTLVPISGSPKKVPGSINAHPTATTQAASAQITTAVETSWARP